MILVVLGKITTEDEHNKYHNFEGLLGKILVIIRALVYCVFIYGIKDTYTKSSEKIKVFLRQLTILGTIYFLALPILVLVASTIIAPYFRHIVI